MAASPVIICDYDTAWPALFDQISQKLKTYLDSCAVDYKFMEHVGSTSVPGLAAKPNIDIIIVVPDEENAQKAKEVLIHEPSAEEHYKCYGDGGIKGRISMKLHVRNLHMDQSVYILAEDNPEGQIIMRCHLALRDTLRKSDNEGLKVEYGRLKQDLSKLNIDTVEYGRRKNPVIRKILKTAGWSDPEIDHKESLDYRIPGEWDDLPY